MLYYSQISCDKMAERVRRYLGDWKITITFDYLAGKKEPVHLTEITKHLSEHRGDDIHGTETGAAVRYLESKGLVEIRGNKAEITEKGEITGLS